MAVQTKEQGLLQRWIEIQGADGNMAAVKKGEELLVEFGDRLPKSVEPKTPKFVVWVDPETPLKDQCDKAGFELRGVRAEIVPWGKSDAPDKPYAIELTDGSKTLGKTWEKGMKDMDKGERRATIFEGIAQVKAHPEILNDRRLAFPGTAHDLYDIFQIFKEGEKIVVSPLSVVDTNTDCVTFDPAKEKVEGEGYSVNGVTIKEGKVTTALPTGFVFAALPKAA